MCRETTTIGCKVGHGGTALVLCGGGSHGALEVGFTRALQDIGIRYDQILGSSIGALNGAFLAGGMPVDELATLWRDVRLWRFLRPNWGWALHPPPDRASCPPPRCGGSWNACFRCSVLNICAHRSPS